MAKKKQFTLNELDELSAGEVIRRIIYNNYSLLATLGAEDLRREMVPVGKVCRTVIDYFLNTTGPKDNPAEHAKNARAKAVKVLKKLTPGKYDGFPKDGERGLVVGFNHPSLGEIGRIMLMKIDMMGDKPMLFPVNLPWYEALAPSYDKIRELGIIITPVISPSTWGKMKLEKGTPLYEAGNRLKKEFRDIYTDLSHQNLKDGGVIFVAPSATRQATVFKTRAAYDGKEEIVPTMSVLALQLYSDPTMNCDFLPMAILPPKNYGRKLNLGKRYELIPGELLSAEYIREKYFKGGVPEKLEGFEHEFLTRIAEKLPKDFWYGD